MIHYNLHGKKVEFDFSVRKVINSILRTVKKLEKLETEHMISFILVDNETIHQINKDYRNIDRPTDVISFAFEDEFEGESKIVLSKDLPRDLGEIFICSDVCIAQAKEYNHSLKREMTFLFTHGLLHLLGYDHMVKEDEEEMFKLQDEIMEVLGL